MDRLVDKKDLCNGLLSLMQIIVSEFVTTVNEDLKASGADSHLFCQTFMPSVCAAVHFMLGWVY